MRQVLGWLVFSGAILFTIGVVQTLVKIISGDSEDYDGLALRFGLAALLFLAGWKALRLDKPVEKI